MSVCDPTPCFHEMAPFTDRQKGELLSFVKTLRGCNVIPIEPLKTSMERLQFPADREICPLKTAWEAILLNDMLASFLSSGKPGHIIAVSGGFGPDGQYYVVGAGNTGKKGVRRPSDELCTALARACEEFILGSTMPLNPGGMFAILVASLDICHADVARRLKSMILAASNTGTLYKQGWQPYINFVSNAAALRYDLERWSGLESREKTEVAIRYGQLLKDASELWDKLKYFGSIQFDHEVKVIYDLNTIAEGLQLLRGFPRGTRVVIEWPQGPVGSDPVGCRGFQHTGCQLHCEIYLSLYILFSESDVQFHSFEVEEKKRVFTIGCSKESCVGCWDILLGLVRQESPNHPQYVCRTHRSHGKCYETWCLNALPPSLQQIVTGQRQTHMLQSLNDALKDSHQKFRQRVESFREADKDIAIRC